MRVYISGKIDEVVISDATRQKFARVQRELEAKGHEVFNPISEEWQSHLRQGYGREIQQTVLVPPGGPISKYAYFLLRDLMALATKDAIYMLKDWKDSFGARTELLFALANNIEVMFEDEFDNLDNMERTSINNLMDIAKSVHGNVNLTLENCNGYDVSLSVKKTIAK